MSERFEFSLDGKTIYTRKAGAKMVSRYQAAVAEILHQTGENAESLNNFDELPDGIRLKLSSLMIEKGIDLLWEFIPRDLKAAMDQDFFEDNLQANTPSEFFTWLTNEANKAEDFLQETPPKTEQPPQASQPLTPSYVDSTAGAQTT